MDDHFDTSGVFEISKFDISKFACITSIGMLSLCLVLSVKKNHKRSNKKEVLMS